MIRDKDKLNRFYRQLTRQERFSYQQALAIYEALHNEAVSLGAITSENIMEGIEVDLRIARALNGLTQ